MRLSAAFARTAVAAAAALALGASAGAEPLRLRLDPATTQVRFTLGATLHTVEGAARLQSGELRLDSEGGAASGRVVIDARSAQTGIASRDANMHENVLESARFPEIVFLPQRLVVVRRDDADRGQVRLEGEIEIHGGRHPAAIPAEVHREGGNVWFQGRFEIPYVEWGLHDPSTFLLRVNPTVGVVVEGVARALPPEPPVASPD
jgi:polyisoprenoid-binding protein YceI